MKEGIRKTLSKEDLYVIARLMDMHKEYQSFIILEYCKKIKDIADGMGWDDQIVFDGDCTFYSHG